MLNLALSFFFPALGGLLYGYDIGAAGMALFGVAKAYPAVESSAVLEGLITSMVTFGAVGGSLFTLKFENRLGRRGELLLASCLYALGSVGEALAAGVGSLCLGRLIYGFGVGCAMHGAPSYIAETAPPHLRGAFVSAKEAMIVVGMLLGYAVGAAFRPQANGWRWTLACAAPIALVMGAGMLVLPRSPRWLALQGRKEEARRALRFVSPEASDDVFDKVVEKPGVLLGDPASKAGMIAGVGLVVLQQVTGQPSVLYYAGQLFEDAGLGATATVGLAAWKLACTTLAVTSVDFYGRRSLLFAGCGLMAVALGALALLASFPAGRLGQYGVLVSMFLYIGGYQVGFGPVTWTVISEIFPLNTRGRALAVATVTNFALNAIVTFVAAPLLNVSAAACFTVFFGLVLYTFYFVDVYVPETRGLALEQITAMLHRRALQSPSSGGYGSDRLLGGDDEKVEEN